MVINGLVAPDLQQPLDISIDQMCEPRGLKLQAKYASPCDLSGEIAGCGMYGEVVLKADVERLNADAGWNFSDSEQLATRVGAEKCFRSFIHCSPRTSSKRRAALV